MNYGEERELDKVFKIDSTSPLVNNLRQLKDKDSDVVNSTSYKRLEMITKEVMKACNIIRPSIAQLTQIPEARK